MVRITVKKNGANRVKVDGRHSKEEAVELVSVCETLDFPLVIDLSDLRFADENGARVLKDLLARGAEVVGARPFVAMLLEGRD